MPIRLLQPSFAGGEISPSLSARVDLAKYQVGLSLARNVFVRPHGGVANRSGTRFVAETADPATPGRLVPFVFNRDQSVLLEFAEAKLRFFIDAAPVTETPVAVTGLSAADPAVLTAPGHGFADGDDIVLDGAALSHRLANRRFRVLSAGVDTLTLGDGDGVPVDLSDLAEAPGVETAARLYAIETPYPAADLAELAWLQSADVMYLTHPDHPPQKLSRHDHTDWTLAPLTFLPAVAAPSGLQISRSGTGGTQYRYVVTAIDRDTGEESLPTAPVAIANDLTVSGHRNTLSWTAHGNADRFPVYKDENGIYGYIGTAEGTGFVDDFIAPDLTDTPPEAGVQFGGPGEYPATAAFFEQRLVLAASRSRPQTLWMSRSGSFESFTVSDPLKDDDAVTVTLVSPQVNAIRHLIPLEDLVILTAGGEWRLSGTAETGAVGPATVRVRPQSYRGAGALPPIVVGSTILFVQRHGAKPRDLGYSFEVDGYTGNDLSVLAPHLFEGHRLVAWTYAQEPHGLIWAIREDGTALTLTYLREHEVWAWCRQETAGAFRDATALPEGDTDRVYVIVRRTVGGRDRYFIERVEDRRPEGATDDRFLDAGLGYDGPPVTVLGGLAHLEGETVHALADGGTVGPLTVVDGSVALPDPASRVWVGLPYVSDVATLPLDPGTGPGAAQGKRKRIGRLALRVQNTRGLSAGPDADRLVPLKPMPGDRWDDPAAPFTGTLEVAIPPAWGPEARVHIRQDAPLPMTLLALYPEVTIGV